MTETTPHEDETNRETDDSPTDERTDNSEQRSVDKREPREPITVPEQQPQNGTPQRRHQEQTIEDTKEKIVGYLYWGTFAAVFLFGAFAAYGFYGSVMDIIDIWVSEDFEPIFEAVFNLVVVLVAILGISLLVGRLDISFSPSSTESSHPEE